MFTDGLSQITKYTIEKIDKVPQDAVIKVLEALLQERELFWEFFVSINRAVVVEDTNGKVLFHNPYAVKWGIIDKNTLVVSEEFRRVFDEIKSNFSEGMLTFETQRVVKVKDIIVPSIMRERVFEILCVASSSPERCKYMYLINDVTKKRKEELDENQKRVISSIDTLLTGIAHELKNPLSSIYFHAQVLKRSLEDVRNNEGRIRNSVDVILYEVNRLNKLINDFIQSLRPSRFVEKYEDVNVIIKEVSEMLLDDTNSKGIFLELVLDDSIPELLCDREVIKILVLNLLRNAIESIEEGKSGRISVSTSIITKDGEDYIVISVKDNGKGIPNEIRHRIFEPYFTTKRYGSGLGLSIVYKIVKDYNGFIEFDSKEGEGTEFRVYLPVGDRLKKLTV